MNKRNLPSPHDRIEVETRRWRSELEVLYLATSRDELIAAGLLTEYMLQKVATQKHGVRRDDKGHKFRLWTIRNGPVCLRRSFAEAFIPQALALPGVRDLHPDGIPDWHEPTEPDPPPTGPYAGKLREVLTAYGDLTVSHIKQRHRVVGRFRRMVNYVCIGKVVIPHWPALVAARFE